MFLGGAIVPLLLDNPGLADIRQTMDIDLAVDVVTRLDYSKIEEELIALRFAPDTSEDAPKCRWKIDGLKVDVMPGKDPTGEWRVRWFDVALETAETRVVDDTPCFIATAPSFIATKMEAFADRGKGDFLASHDMEDIIAVIDGRASLEADVRASSNALRTYIADTMAAYIENEAFLESLSGHLPPDAASQQRLPGLIKKVHALAAIAPEGSEESA
ncbi:MAG: hypothetical protein JRC99_13635 [Deltaproteobacteria bacterium]|nr:hypothetical protein [Deltaproteobacteria bacterium]